MNGDGSPDATWLALPVCSKNQAGVHPGIPQPKRQLVAYESEATNDRRELRWKVRRQQSGQGQGCTACSEDHQTINRDCISRGNGEWKERAEQDCRVHEQDRRLRLRSEGGPSTAAAQCEKERQETLAALVFLNSHGRIQGVQGGHMNCESAAALQSAVCSLLAPAGSPLRLCNHVRRHCTRPRPRPRQPGADRATPDKSRRGRRQLAGRWPAAAGS